MTPFWFYLTWAKIYNTVYVSTTLWVVLIWIAIQRMAKLIDILNRPIVRLSFRSFSLESGFIFFFVLCKQTFRNCSLIPLSPTCYKSAHKRNRKRKKKNRKERQKKTPRWFSELSQFPHRWRHLHSVCICISSILPTSKICF